MLAASAAVKCPYCQTYHREVSKMMWGASDEELDELAVIVGQTSFWSNVLHTELRLEYICERITTNQKQINAKQS